MASITLGMLRFFSACLFPQRLSYEGLRDLAKEIESVLALHDSRVILQLWLIAIKTQMYF